jgi:hypothetical protein
MAEIMGCEPSQLSMLEAGKRAWTTKYIYAICEHFGIPAAEFLGAVAMNDADRKLWETMRELVTLKNDERTLSQTPPKGKAK